jgi:dethiobiotin synthetase
MRSLLVVISGTGTGIGKTHLAEALLRCLGEAHARVVGLKPIETGVDGASASDAVRLERASTFHVKQSFGHAFAEGLSPHLAARRAGAEPISIPPLVATIRSIRSACDVAVVELPGGLFTPISDFSVNADFARELDPDATLLVALDQLGVLHNVLSTLRAAQSCSLTISGIVLFTPEVPDASTGLNEAEIHRLVRPPFVVTIPRADAQDLANHPNVRDIAARIGGLDRSRRGRPG